MALLAVVITVIGWQAMKSVFDDRRERFQFEKDSIAAFLSHYLRRHSASQPIAVDGGSTNYSVIKAIVADAKAGQPTVSQVVTNHLPGIFLASELPEGCGVVWRSTGGILRWSRSALVVGAEKCLDSVDIHLAVIGANGLHPPTLQTATGTEHAIKRAMLEKARVVVFPIDSSKWGRTTGEHLVTIAELVKQQKRVEIFTCYPVRDVAEAEKDFTDRWVGFTQCASEMHEQAERFEYAVNVFAAALTKNGGCLEDEQCLVTGNDFLKRIEKAYHATISPNDDRETAFVLRFEFTHVPQ